VHLVLWQFELPRADILIREKFDLLIFLKPTTCDRTSTSPSARE